MPKFFGVFDTYCAADCKAQKRLAGYLTSSCNKNGMGELRCGHERSSSRRQNVVLAMRDGHGDGD